MAKKKKIILGNQNIREFTSWPDWQMGVNAGLDYKRLVKDLLKSGLDPEDIRVQTYEHDDYSDVLFVNTRNKKLPLGATVAIGQSCPNECSLDKHGWLRLWWD